MSSAKHSNLQKGKAILILLTNSENKIDDCCLFIKNGQTMRTEVLQN